MRRFPHGLHQVLAGNVVQVRDDAPSDDKRDIIKLDAESERAIRHLEADDEVVVLLPGEEFVLIDGPSHCVLYYLCGDVSMAKRINEFLEGDARWLWLASPSFHNPPTRAQPTPDLLFAHLVVHIAEHKAIGQLLCGICFNVNRTATAIGTVSPAVALIVFLAQVAIIAHAVVLVETLVRAQAC